MNQSRKEVPFFNYPQLFKQREDAFIAALRDVGNRGAFIMQKDVTEFENALARYVGTKYTVAVANATDALELGFIAGGIQQGDEVIICSHTMVATAAAVHVAGGVPIPVEVGSDRCIDLDSI